jgi:peptidoglycan/LPS O-acetylase OafA/YrhL
MMSAVPQPDVLLSPIATSGRAAVPHAKRRLIHVRELDGVRGIAAIAVFFHHLCFTSIEANAWGPGVQLLAGVSEYGAAGVDLFFVLSGFLITSLLIEDRESERYYQDFYWKRALRILPLYLVCLLGVLVFYPHSGGYVLMSALFIANFAWIFHVVSSGPFWTLAIEEQFYLLWPTVVRRRSIKTIERWALGVGLGAVILRLIAAYFGHHNYYFTFFHCDGLAAGAWIACRFERWSREGFCTRQEKIAWGVGLLTAVVLYVAFLYMHGSERSVAFGAAFYQTAVMLSATALIAFLLLHRGKPYLGIFRSRFLTFFGLISYALYMMHIYVMDIYDHFTGAPQVGDVRALVVRFFAVLGITITLCLLSRYMLELPAASLRRYVVKPESPPPAIAEPV